MSWWGWGFVVKEFPYFISKSEAKDRIQQWALMNIIMNTVLGSMTTVGIS
jgi:hypothetical protein